MGVEGEERGKQRGKKRQIKMSKIQCRIGSYMVSEELIEECGWKEWERRAGQ